VYTRASPTDILARKSTRRTKVRGLCRRAERAARAAAGRPRRGACRLPHEGVRVGVGVRVSPVEFKFYRLTQVVCAGEQAWWQDAGQVPWRTGASRLIPRAQHVRQPADTVTIFVWQVGLQRSRSTSVPTFTVLSTGHATGALGVRNPHFPPGAAQDF